MDEDYVRAVTHVFVRLVEKGLIYRDNYMVNWDPGTGSAISDLEVVQRRVEDTLYMIDYPLESGSGSVTVATARPETILADTAIAVNPGDERYSRLIGERAVLPLVGRRLEVIADEYVDPEFGTGALKITPGHDPNDFEIGRRHGLDEVVGHRRGRPHDRRRPGGATAGSPSKRPSGRWSRRCERRASLRHPALLARRAALAALRDAHRAAHLAAVVLRHGRAGQAGDRVRARRPRALPPGEAVDRRLPRLAREHPPLVRLAPALVGPPDPGLVPRRRDLRGRERPRGRGLASATRTCSTPGSPRRCGRSPRSDGREETPGAARPSTPRTCSRRRATSSFSGSPAW